MGRERHTYCYINGFLNLIFFLLQFSRTYTGGADEKYQFKLIRGGGIVERVISRNKLVDNIECQRETPVRLLAR